jgi:hypothetical protein
MTTSIATRRLSDSVLASSAVAALKVRLPSRIARWIVSRRMEMLLKTKLRES